MRDDNNKLTTEEFTGNSDAKTINVRTIKNGKFFQLISLDDESLVCKGFEVKVAPRTIFKVLYIKNKEDIVSFEIIKLIKKSEKLGFKEEQRVKLSKFTFEDLVEFLELIKNLDLNLTTNRRIKLRNFNIDEQTEKLLIPFLEKPDGIEFIKKLLQNEELTSEDIVNTGYRKKQRKIFYDLLYNDTLMSYRESESHKQKGLSSNSKEEAVWQYFFKQNEWIFGYGLDYRFQNILQNEFATSNSEANGSNVSYTDYLIGDKRFTTFVELKKPNTPLFRKTQNRANCWKLSNELFEAVSQILEHKASGQIKLESEQHDGNGNVITQKAYDSKVILIIGNWSEIKEDSDLVQKMKKKTFELFRRDSRNIDILTYDELYERAKYIVGE